ncbi:hypothetical protein HDV06_002620 [Boothiomyces sp. JEL0866]|nr:hypothetical protein HDV06_002620 [Boothiomyces sp. JEL0866]
MLEAKFCKVGVQKGVLDAKDHEETVQKLEALCADLEICTTGELQDLIRKCNTGLYAESVRNNPANYEYFKQILDILNTLPPNSISILKHTMIRVKKARLNIEYYNFRNNLLQHGYAPLSTIVNKLYKIAKCTATSYTGHLVMICQFIKDLDFHDEFMQGYFRVNVKKALYTIENNQSEFVMWNVCVRLEYHLSKLDEIIFKEFIKYYGPLLNKKIAS